VKIIYKAGISVQSMLSSAVVTPLVAAALYTSAKALARDERSLWLTKFSSTVLTAFLIVLMP
jgi:CBS domain containing-hemolysin-like protein